MTTESIHRENDGNGSGQGWSEPGEYISSQVLASRASSSVYGGLAPKGGDQAANC